VLSDRKRRLVARQTPRRRQVSEGLFSLMRDGIIKSLMRLFKKHQERKGQRERNRQRKHRSKKKKKG
jgi:hypothetical protein